MVLYERAQLGRRPRRGPRSASCVPDPAARSARGSRGGRRPAAWACTSGVSRSAVPARTAVGSSSLLTPPVSSRPTSTVPQRARTPGGQACTMRAQASICSAVAPGPMVAYFSARLASGDTGPSGARERSSSRWARRRPCGLRSANTRDSAGRSALPVLHSSAAAARSRSCGRSAAAMIVMPPMEWPPTTARSPASRVASSTATRSSASAWVLWPAGPAAGLRPWPRWS